MFWFRAFLGAMKIPIASHEKGSLFYLKIKL